MIIIEMNIMILTNSLWFRAFHLLTLQYEKICPETRGREVFAPAGLWVPLTALTVNRELLSQTLSHSSPKVKLVENFYCEKTVMRIFL